MPGGQHHCNGVSADDHYGLLLQGRDGLVDPGGVAPTPVLLEPGAILAPPAHFSSAGVSQAQWRGLPSDVVCPAKAPAPARGRGGSGCTSLRSDLGLVDLAGRVQIESRGHRETAASSSEIMTALGVWASS